MKRSVLSKKGINADLTLHRFACVYLCCAYFYVKPTNQSPRANTCKVLFNVVLPKVKSRHISQENCILQKHNLHAVG